jgi:TM2 domain-containing membrane protein YozV
MRIYNLQKEIQEDYELLNQEERTEFKKEFNDEKKDVSISWILFVFLGGHYFYVGKYIQGMLIATLSLLGIGFVWLLWDLFTLKASRLVKAYNNELAKELILDIKHHSQKENNYEE